MAFKTPSPQCSMAFLRWRSASRLPKTNIGKAFGKVLRTQHQKEGTRTTLDLRHAQQYKRRKHRSKFVWMNYLVFFSMRISHGQGACRSRQKRVHCPSQCGYSVPRLARYLQNARKRHQDAVFWVDIDLGIKEGLRFYQTRSNAIILQGTLPANCIVRAERLRNGEKLYERQYLSPRPPPKISLKHDLNRETRSTVTWRNTSIWFVQANPIP